MTTLLVVGALILYVFFWNRGAGDVEHPGDAIAPEPARESSVASASENENRTFAIGFPRLFLFLLAGSVAGSLPLLKLDERLEFSWHSYTMEIVFLGLPGCLIGALLVRRFGQLVLNRAGIHDCPALLGGNFVGWEDMECRYLKLLWINFVLVKSPSTRKRIALLPSIYRKPEFRDCVIALAPTDCALLKFLPA